MPDPIIPIIEPDAPYREFKLADIYTGPFGTGRWVPNQDDSAWDWTAGARYRVVAVDYTSGLSTLQLYVPPAQSSSAVDEDVLLGSGPGAQSESYRVYINKSVLPFRLAYDARLRIYGSNASYVKLFRGTNIGDTGIVISGMFDQNDVMISENIPLETVVLPNNSSVAVKTPIEAYATEDLDDGEVVTSVAYSASGVALSYSKMLVKNTAFVRTANASRKFITSISLITPFLSESDNHLIQVPTNIPLSSTSLMGLVQYSNGEQLLLPVDGTKFQLLGINAYVNTVVGARASFVFIYRLGEDEFSVNVQENNGVRFMTEDYDIETVEADGSYTVKLFTYPVWVGGTNGYRLEHFLYRLDRDEVFYVTPQVEFGINSDTWNPLQYGGEQSLVFALDLADVDPIFDTFRHVQTTGITLIGPGTLKSDAWRVNYTPGGLEYGATVFAHCTENGPNWNIDLSSDCTTQSEWLERVYERIEPLYNPVSESGGPAPTHFYIVVGVFRMLRTVAQWNTLLTNIDANIVQGQPVYLEWINQSVGGDLQLGVSALPAHTYSA